MEGILRKGVVFFFAFTMIMLLCQTGFSRDDTDNLLLTGFIKSYDINNRIIRINVTSEGCTGLMEFWVPEYAKDDLDASLIGQRVQFYIKSSTCEQGKIYEMVLER